VRFWSQLLSDDHYPTILRVLKERLVSFDVNRCSLTHIPLKWDTSGPSWVAKHHFHVRQRRLADNLEADDCYPGTFTCQFFGFAPPSCPLAEAGLGKLGGMGPGHLYLHFAWQTCLRGSNFDITDWQCRNLSFNTTSAPLTFKSPGVHPPSAYSNNYSSSPWSKQSHLSCAATISHLLLFGIPTFSVFL
jgi:hypothetical protein